MALRESDQAFPNRLFPNEVWDAGIHAVEKHFARAPRPDDVLIFRPGTGYTSEWPEVASMLDDIHADDKGRYWYGYPIFTSRGTPLLGRNFGHMTLGWPKPSSTVAAGVWNYCFWQFAYIYTTPTGAKEYYVRGEALKPEGVCMHPAAAAEVLDEPLAAARLLAVIDRVPAPDTVTVTQDAVAIKERQEVEDNVWLASLAALIAGVAISVAGAVKGMSWRVISTGLLTAIGGAVAFVFAPLVNRTELSSVQEVREVALQRSFTYDVALQRLIARRRDLQGELVERRKEIGYV